MNWYRVRVDFQAESDDQATSVAEVLVSRHITVPQGEVALVGNTLRLERLMAPGLREILIDLGEKPE